MDGNERIVGCILVTAGGRVRRPEERKPDRRIEDMTVEELAKLVGGALETILPLPVDRKGSPPGSFGALLDRLGRNHAVKREIAEFTVRYAKLVLGCDE